MRILITGANGFIGKNLVATLNNIAGGKDKSYGIDFDITVMEYDLGTDDSLFTQYCKQADFVVNLAGINRPEEQSDFKKGNTDFAGRLLKTLKDCGNCCPVLLSSSTQAQSDSPYGLSKRAGEELVFKYGRETGAQVYVYRFPNVFGKWCRPNYNSAIATFCNNIASGLPITVTDRSKKLNLVYIDDVVREIIDAVTGGAHKCGESGFCCVPVTYEATLGEIVDLLYSFNNSRSECSLPDVGDPFARKLYAAYLSYLPADDFSYPLKMNIDERGSFTEIFKTPDRGQVSVNITKPGVTKGNHWHHTKNEKFCVVSGKGVIKLRNILGGDIIEYHVSGENIKTVDIPTGYTHSIANEGDTELVTIMWASELFDPGRPDTYFEEV